MAARRAHNPKVAGSSPVPATKKNDSALAGSFFLIMVPGEEPASVATGSVQ